MLEASKAASIRDFWSRLKAGFSVGAAAVRPGRDNELVDSSGEEVFPRIELLDGSSFFIVRPFLFRLEFEVQYYGLC
jgi:hypothetical protein